MLHDSKTPGPEYAALTATCPGFHAFADSLRLNEEIARNWIEFLQKRYSKDMGALQRSIAIKSPGDFTSFASAFWKDVAEDYSSEWYALQKILFSRAATSPLRATAA